MKGMKSDGMAGGLKLFHDLSFFRRDFTDDEKRDMGIVFSEQRERVEPVPAMIIVKGETYRTARTAAGSGRKAGSHDMIAGHCFAHRLVLSRFL